MGSERDAVRVVPREPTARRPADQTLFRPIGPYVPIALVGQGGMGAVYAAEELLVLAARIEEKRARLRSRRGRILRADEALRRAAGRSLPFSLTRAQRRAVGEIASDLGSGRAMARLLQGDVGSGKTVVAGLAMLLCAPAALAAPTMPCASSARSA